MKKQFKNLKLNILPIILFIILLIYSISLFLPIIWTLLNSLKGRIEFIRDPFALPKKWLFSNYNQAFLNIKLPVQVEGGGSRDVFFIEMLSNSLLYAIGCAFVAMFVPCLVAYPVAKYNHPFNKVIYSIVIVTMILPIVGATPSMLNIMDQLGLLDTLIGAYIMKANFLGMYFLVFYASFKGLSWTYAEAALMDGANHWQILFKIMIPLIKNSMLVVFVLQFIAFWNDYQTPMVYLPSMPTAAYGLHRFYGDTQTGTSSTPIKLSACIIVMFPILILFLIFKDKMMGNLTVGGIKG